jgi:hypothetical protein
MQISLFFAVQAVTVMQWARLSDHIGRKPVLLTGLFGLFISMVLFGLSRTFWALVFRCVVCFQIFEINKCYSVEQSMPRWRVEWKYRCHENHGGRVN